LKFKFAWKSVEGQIDSLSLNHLNAKKKGSKHFQWENTNQFRKGFSKSYNFVVESF